MYMDSKKHSEATGSKATVSRKVGGVFSAWDGFIRGRNLQIVRDRLIVQAWRGSDMKKTDPDTILVLRFDKSKKGARVTMFHTNVPASQLKELKGGWYDFYWKPWKQYLQAGT